MSSLRILPNIFDVKGRRTWFVHSHEHSTLPVVKRDKVESALAIPTPQPRDVKEVSQ